MTASYKRVGCAPFRARIVQLYVTILGAGITRGIMLATRSLRARAVMCMPACTGTSRSPWPVELRPLSRFFGKVYMFLQPAIQCKAKEEFGSASKVHGILDQGRTLIIVLGIVVDVNIRNKYPVCDGRPILYQVVLLCFYGWCPPTACLSTRKERCVNFSCSTLRGVHYSTCLHRCGAAAAGAMLVSSPGEHTLAE